jgi:glycosyltransferase involved in cell wall biosynthesis
MASVEFQSSEPLLGRAQRLDAAAPRRTLSRPRKPRLALISTYNELCGIAAYTASLERQLSSAFDVTVFDLNQYLLRSVHRRVRKFGDRHIREICREIREFGYVNLQLEHGTLGHAARDIFRRFTWIARDAQRLTVTFHTVMQSHGFDLREYMRVLMRGQLARAIAMRAEYNRAYLLSAGIAARLRRAQRFKPVSVVVHTRRDLAHMKYVHGLRHVYDHPLSFLTESEANEVVRTATRDRFPVLDELPADAKLIGVFGFLGRYKGFDTAIRALHHLPEAYHLLIFGGVHPNEIRQHQAIDPVVASLFDAGFVDTSVPERVRAAVGAGAPAVSLAVDRSMRDLLTAHPKDLSRRVHFLGAPSDADFLAGMAICDAVVFPYLEVGQSSSGPISQALELGCRIIASRTHTFLQYSRYHPETIEFFDIGNHLELAARITARPQFDPARRRLAFDVDSNRETYIAALGATGQIGRSSSGISDDRVAGEGDRTA